ncbi:bifunctional protein GlmU-like isoform X1 [Homalodisca vitripennis]|uniref:bifunctional protein GlmU-like isoform X1 n=1 Tax=Homalodisca vitripennis TaxID=197043 RepID=UPI001EEADF2E|nr:bifunctional protein GlmU-like isoform X1 [Homalodisca vitripennis]KAG8257345.1 hypothetical protein J6590_052213 [Homalodisca vitripennis]
MASNIRVFTISLKHGTDLKDSIEEFIVDKGLKAPFIVTCVGSLNSATLALNATASGGPPFPSYEKVKSFDNENFEICSLVGTLSPMGSHLHIVLGRADGSVVAGHVVGNVTVQTTAEVVIGESMAEIYNRKYDPFTSYNELAVLKRE